jgi:hypothetical protein
MYYINEHEVILNQQEQLEPWTSHDRVVYLAMNFIKHCPVDPKTGLPWYLLYSCFWTDPLRPTIWPDNPAGKFAWAVTTLLRYYPYSGDGEHISIVRSMLDRLLEYFTPAHYAWDNVPYASAHPGTGVYFGARADGEYATEPDKVAQAGAALVDFYRLSGEERYLHAAEACAQTLLSHLVPGDAEHSPVPFRVDVRDGSVIEAYTADMVQLLRFFGSLSALGKSGYEKAHQNVLDWIIQYPLRNNCWKGYFEDIRLDPENGNRDQLTALETARYFLEHPQYDPSPTQTVPGLITWVQEQLGAEPFFGAVAVHEQKYCYHVMGSHTARFAALSALWGEKSGDQRYTEIAHRSLNWAAYMADENGWVRVGTDRPDYYNQCWFTDGYFDYVPHFIDVMSCLPELAPEDSDHLLRASGVIKDINYRPYHISYTTFEENGSERLKLTFEPVAVLSGDEELPYQSLPGARQGWAFDKTTKLLHVNHPHARVSILGKRR